MWFEGQNSNFTIIPGISRRSGAPIPYRTAANRLHTLQRYGNDLPIEFELNNGEVVYGPYSLEVIKRFNKKYDKAITKGINVSTDFWDFNKYLKGESIVGNYVAHFIQQLEEVPDDFEEPETFALSGVEPTYNAARLYANPWGNCYSTSASRINKGYEDLYGVTPIDYTKNKNGTFTSVDYKTASTQVGAQNFGYGVGGALANGGEADLITNLEVWEGALHPGAALQVWHTTDQQNLTSGGGHSQIFLNYTYDSKGVINGMDVFDNSGVVEHLNREDYEEYEIIRAGNLLDPK